MNICPHNYSAGYGLACNTFLKHFSSVTCVENSYHTKLMDLFFIVLRDSKVDGPIVRQLYLLLVNYNATLTALHLQ